ncbi:hypothetical protein [Fusibacter sp. JL216-2]|uniref:hypothetical protein n=1 Tax=Fusibacter sp. JL216-2 TaxID=3071453 RepID=UPI003D33176B
MRIINAIMVIGLVVLAAGCVEIQSTAKNVVSISSPIEITQTFEDEFEALDVIELVIDGYAGDIKISQSDDTDKVSLVSELVVRGRTEEAVQEAVGKLRLASKISSNTMTLKVESKKIMNNDVNSLNNTYTLIIPKTIVKLNIMNDTGDTILDGSFEDVVATRDVGDLIINGAVNNLDSKTDVGDVKLDGSIGSIKLKSNVGDAKLVLRENVSNSNLEIKHDISDVKIYLPKGSTISNDSNTNAKIKSTDITYSDDGVTIKNNSKSMTEIIIYDLERLN